jgi:hypothetical protein
VKLDRDDIDVRPIANVCEECETGNLAEHEVWVDFRECGFERAVFVGCKECCEMIARGIKASLPGRSKADV